jgi:hypothetical protein
VKLFLVTMVRNELDVLHPFLEHIDALFDSGCVFDHMSADGSEELLRRFAADSPSWEYRRVDQPHFVQADLSNRALTEAFRGGADAVFFLDADEFIRRLGRTELEGAVEQLANSRQVGHLRWRNCWPAVHANDFQLDEPVWHGAPSEHKKLVLPRWAFDQYGDKLRVNQGNHSLLLPDGQWLPEVMLGELLHFPVRSRQQLLRKIFTSYVSMGMRADRVVAPHYRRLFDVVVEREMTASLLIGIAEAYGVPGAPIQERAPEELRELGYLLDRPLVARKTRPKLQLTPRPLEPVDLFGAPSGLPETQALLETIASRDSSIQRLTSENQRLTTEAERMRNSRSWKATAPIRKVVQGVKHRVRDLTKARSVFSQLGK